MEPNISKEDRNENEIVTSKTTQYTRLKPTVNVLIAFAL